MPICLLHADSLKTLNNSADADSEELMASDSRDDYYAENADGVWISAYLEFIQKIVRERCGLPDLCFTAP